MAGYLRSLKVASWIELVVAVIWFVAAIAMTVFSLIAWTTVVDPARPPGASAPPLSGAMIFVILGVLGGGPSLITGLVFRSEHRRQSTGWSGTVLGLVFGVVYLTLIGVGILTSQPNSGPIDVDFLVIGGMIGVTGVSHLAAAIATLVGRTTMHAASGPSGAAMTSA